ncbi:hypothetical protein H7170_03515 [Candidatus Gracilibacteria bacterium]|nr:hypothetical protein [Candidatus Gracilibacteria bacterium]
MTKQLIAGLATIVVAGSALIGTSIYAASTTSTGTISSRTQGVHMDRQTPEQMVASLSGKISPEAITAFTTLMARHKTEMDALRTNIGTTVDKATMEANRTAFRTEMDALMAKYPDLKAALPTPPQGGKHRNNPMASLLAGVSAVDKAAIEAIHTDYDAREKILKTEEKAKIDTIIANYPEIKAKLDAMKAVKQIGDGEKDDGDHDGDRGGHGGQRGR